LTTVGRIQCSVPLWQKLFSGPPRKGRKTSRIRIEFNLLRKWRVTYGANVAKSGRASTFSRNASKEAGSAREATHLASSKNFWSARADMESDRLCCVAACRAAEYNFALMNTKTILERMYACKLLTLGVTYLLS